MQPGIRTAVIPAAGLGTRFLPLTKSIPKEMLPVLDRPLIHYAVQELAEAGIDHVVLVTARGKGALEDYFDQAPELDDLDGPRQGRGDDLDGPRAIARELRSLTQMARITSVRQPEQKGLGHAVLCARPAVGAQPFVVLLPDDLILAPIASGHSPSESATRQMLRMWESRLHWDGCLVAVEEVPLERVSSYGVVKSRPVSGEERLYQVEALVEKPPVREAPSNLAIVGRYILTPHVFEALERTRPGRLGEIQLTDAIALLLEREPVYAYRFEGLRLDCGTPEGLLRASLEVALRRKDLGPQMRGWIRGSTTV